MGAVSGGLAVFALLLLASASSCRALYILPPDGNLTEATHLQSPRITWTGAGPPPYPVVGPALFLDDIHSSANYSGMVVFYQFPGFHFAEDAINTLRASGIAALVSISYHDPPGITQYEKARYSWPDSPFPVFEISPTENDTLSSHFSSNSTLVVIFQADETNPWDNVYLRYMPIMTNLILAFTGVIMVIGVYKWTTLIIRDGVRFNLSQIVLAFNLVGLILRFAWCFMDPFGSYHVSTFAWVQMGITLPIPFVISGGLIIALWWHEMIQRTGHIMNTFLDRMFVPFIVLSCVMCLWEILTSALRGAGAVTVILLIVEGFLYAVITLSLLVFFIVTKIRLDRVFRQLNRSLNLGRNKLKVASHLTVAIGIFLFILLALFVVVGTGSTFWIPNVMFACMTGYLTSINILSLLQILLIRSGSRRDWLYIMFGYRRKSDLDSPSSTYSTSSGVAASTYTSSLA